MRTTRLLGAAVWVLWAQPLFAQVVFSENFESGTVGGLPPVLYTTSVTAGDAVATIQNPPLQTSNKVLQHTNDFSASPNVNGTVRTTFPTTALAPSWNNILQNNAGPITWTFNMRKQSATPPGISPGQFSAATVLATTAENLVNGYAVVIGSSSPSSNPIRLVRFSNGLSNTTVTELLSSGDLVTNPITDVGALFMSVRVTFDPATKVWSFAARSDGGTSFADPTTGPAMTSVGSIVDNTFTNTPMSHMGWYFTYGTTSTTAYYDNLTISIAPVPEPGTLLCVGLTAMGGCVWRRRRHRRAENALLASGPGGSGAEA